MAKKNKEELKDDLVNQTTEESVDTEESETVEETVIDEETNDGDLSEKNENEPLEDNSLILELETLKTTNLRITAEFQNYKKRVEKEKSDIYKFANEKLMTDLLSIVDNFERAIGSFEITETNSSFVSGIEMIKKSLDEFMNKNNVEAIDSVGKLFDPNFHHAVMTEESDDHDEQSVISEFQKGYTLNGKVIRPSMVKVSK